MIVIAPVAPVAAPVAIVAAPLTSATPKGALCAHAQGGAIRTNSASAAEPIRSPMHRRRIAACDVCEFTLPLPMRS
ncbi:hypothetical protein WJ89_09625 [Burkholderia ubonensis]|nr:hypothetical protein WJ89_09625 [Burkholderia ubonensis]KVQ75217.1 hypothetical protein WK06_01255 [Burkholderia ubonensis]KWD29515.1 hypothetical protein WL63_27760 [Burkholderia ubonensis]KWD46909.1 hypothetical protein WL64_01805 [Burkholderia ubonensis]KWO97711.1 hypothetical protein WM35_16315 [Burkholderia ubonensis]